MRHCGESFVFWILIFLKAWRNTSLGEGKHLQEGRGDGGAVASDTRNFDLVQRGNLHTTQPFEF